MKKSRKKTNKKMKDEWSTETTESCCTGKSNTCGGMGYCLGILGSAVYYISTATGFWNGVWGVVKALVWPAFVTFELLKFLGA